MTLYNICYMLPLVSRFKHKPKAQAKLFSTRLKNDLTVVYIFPVSLGSTWFNLKRQLNLRCK